MDLQSLLTSLAALSALLAGATAGVPAVSAPPITLVPIVASAAVPTQELALSLGSLRGALVNIVCLSSDPSIHSVTGSGVMIDPRGLILTVAHMGQYFILQDREPTKVQCVIRTGNPARKAYVAEPVYVSPKWITENPDTLTDKAPHGTGEDDFAVLEVTGTATSTPVPSVFPYVALSPLGHVPSQGEPIAVGGYPAQTLTTQEISQSLYPSLVFSSVQQRYTFSTTSVDAIALGGSAAAQEGSSGGGATNIAGQVIGIITTSTVSGDLSARDLRAITLDHIRRSFYADTGVSFDWYLSHTSLDGLIKNFQKEDVALGKELIRDIRNAH